MLEAPRTPVASGSINLLGPCRMGLLAVRRVGWDALLLWAAQGWVTDVEVRPENAAHAC